MITLRKAGITSLVLLFLTSLHLLAHVQLDFPREGLNFVTDEHVTIEWTLVVAHDQNDWDLVFSPDGGTTWETLAADLTVDTRSFLWVVPDISTEHALIKIIQDNKGGNYESVSGEFSINAQPLSLFSRESEEQEGNDLSIYPVPALDVLYFTYTYSGEGAVNLSIYSPSGQQVLEVRDYPVYQGKQTLSWNLPNLPSGMYSYRFSTSDREETGILPILK